ncbi:MAG: hypothetical protein JSV38_05205, partial [Desulfobacterales bacterium]
NEISINEQTTCLRWAVPLRLVHIIGTIKILTLNLLIFCLLKNMIQPLCTMECDQYQGVKLA